MTISTDLLEAELELTGRIVSASNATYVAAIGSTQVVYKPISGERPLWDFPDGTLAAREVASYEVSQVMGWDVVPPTWLRDGPHGPGMVQLWREPNVDDEPVTLVPVDQVPEGWLRIVDGFDAAERPVALVHEDTADLRRMAVFDAVVNNADRKGGHVLAMPDGHRHGVDHGLTFHAEHKLRTVLWGWMGQPLSEAETEGVTRIADALESELGARLAELITPEEIEALAGRCSRLVDRARFPVPRGEMPAVPWPPF